MARGSRRLRMGNGFFTGYRRNVIEPDEVLIWIFLPRTRCDQYFFAYKQSKRREDDIAIVNMALSVTFQAETDVIAEMNLAFGGMAATVALTPDTCAQHIGRRWNREMVETICDGLMQELPLDPSAPGGMIRYRKSLTLSLFFKAYLEIAQLLQGYISDRTPIEAREQSGATTFRTVTPKSCQLYERLPGSDIRGDPVGAPLVHASAYKQATGEAMYCDDMPRMDNELYLALVLSTKAHARIVSIDASEALAMDGVVAFYSAKDLPTWNNMVGPVVQDEEMFASERVTAYGQTIGAVVADRQKQAQEAARRVKVVYEEIEPVILTIEDAIAHKSYLEPMKEIGIGDIDRAMADADIVFSGECRMGGQEHFYLETQVTVAVPRDSDELEVYCSTQDPSDIQRSIKRVTGLPSSRVTLRTKRMGGGFGGKQCRPILVALPVAFAAHRSGRPVRCMLDRDVDMHITGTRHPFYCRYKVAATQEGRLLGLDVEIYNNAGNSADLSMAVLEKAMLTCTNSYAIQNCRVRAWSCRTNLVSNTAFRGFGGPQGMFIAENAVRELARLCGKTEVEVAEMNLVNEGHQMHYNQPLINCNLRRCWSECLAQSQYYRRLREVDEFNRLNRWRKRGLAMVPTTFGIAYTELFLNQTGALVHIYDDGSVLVSHGGTEMGQGLHTKMIQVAARALGIPADRITISETATDKVPNTPATAASSGSDLNGMAVLNACEILRARLRPYSEADPKGGWDSWVNKAYFDRCSLSTTGFHRMPDVGYDLVTNRGMAYSYFTYGAACSEVEIDCLTGDHQVRRTDIVMDLGASLNPAIDIGQIEGGFMQGYGLFTMEEVIYSATGAIWSRGPGAYKIPGFSDIPTELNVSLLKGVSNPRAVYSSKAVGEPPLFLASSVFFAIKNAIGAARCEEDLTERFDLVSPATSERIRVACHDTFVGKVFIWIMRSVKLNLNIFQIFLFH